LEPKKILTEDDFLAFYMRKYLETPERYFPKVHTVSTLKISPDIDLLFVNKRPKLLVGHEFKLLRYHRGWKRVNYNAMYAGIGEALLYFQHGVDKCYLVLGLTEMPSEWVDMTLGKIDKAIENFNMLTKLFTSWSNEIQENRSKTLPEWARKFPVVRPIYEGLGDSEKDKWGFGCFGIMVWTERDRTMRVLKNADQHFPISKNPDLKHKKECLLRGEFKYKKSFLNKVAGKPEQNTKEVRLKPKYILP